MKIIGLLLLLFTAVMSVNAVIITVYDKRAAIRRERRVPEKTLMRVGALFGSFAMFVTMIIIRHKTLHTKFMVGLPLMALAQSAVICLCLIL